MTFVTPVLNYAQLAPILIVLAGAVIGVLIEAFAPRAARHSSQLFISTFSLVAAFAALMTVRNQSSVDAAMGSVAFDGAAVLIQASILIISFLAIFLIADQENFTAMAAAVPGSEEERQSLQKDLRVTEVYPLTLFAVAGMLIFPIATDLIMLFVALEILSLPLYLMAGLSRRRRLMSQESALKYFLLGAFSSAFFLFGVAYLYGYSGSITLSGIQESIVGGSGNDIFLLMGIAFLSVGLLFKVGAVPFHAWTPDVYQGAPTAVTLMIAGAPKLAAFAIVIRMLVEGLLPLAIDWQQMLALLAIASLLVGNLAAIAQTNLKRMLAYSTIAQMGFVLIGLMSGVVSGNAAMGANAYSSAMFYVVGYVLTTLATFGIILLLARQGFESEEITDLAGLNSRSPLYAGVMAICMFSLAGIPPMVGFYAKLSVLQALIASGHTADIAMAVFAVAMSLVGAFYYLRVVKVMYFDEAVTATTVSAAADVRVVLSLNGLLILVLGIVPGALMSLCARSVTQMLAN